MALVPETKIPKHKSIERLSRAEVFPGMGRARSSSASTPLNFSAAPSYSISAYSVSGTYAAGPYAAGPASSIVPDYVSGVSTPSLEQSRSPLGNSLQQSLSSAVYYQSLDNDVNWVRGLQRSRMYRTARVGVRRRLRLTPQGMRRRIIGSPQ